MYSLQAKIKTSCHNVEQQIRFQEQAMVSKQNIVLLETIVQQ